MPLYPYKSDIMFCITHKKQLILTKITIIKATLTAKKAKLLTKGCYIKILGTNVGEEKLISTNPSSVYQKFTFLEISVAISINSSLVNFTLEFEKEISFSELIGIKCI